MYKHMVRRMLCCLLCVVLLAGCAQSAPVETEAPTTVPPTTEAPTEPTETEPPVPETVAGTALVDKAYVVMLNLNRDETVDIVGEWDENYYVVKNESGFGLVEKRLVRLEGEEVYEQWNGYARQKAKLYTSYYLNDEEPATLAMNTEVTVLDTLGNCLVVQTEDTVGYMLEKEVSRYYIQPYSGGGGGGGTGADGGDISLGIQGGINNLSVFAPQSGDVTGKATVLANDTEILLGWYDREETMEVVAEEGFVEFREGYHAVYIKGMYGYVRDIYVLKDGDTPFEQWEGYAKRNAAIYDNYYLTGDPVTKPTLNAKMTVLLDIGNCYLVSIGDVVGYVTKDLVSANYVNYNYGGGGGGGGGEWTPPAM